MKKIIALAVAGAFVAPVYAADVTVSGSMTYNYIASDASAIGDRVESDDNQVAISASQELDNGMSISAKFAIVDDTSSGTEHQGNNITVKGDFGSLSIGDNSGALDATGDWTDKSPVFGGFDADGTDQAILLALPSFQGFDIKASMSPSGDNYVNDETAGDLAGDEEGLEATSVSVTYSAGAFGLYYGTEEYDRANSQTVKGKAYGVKYSANGLYIAAEKGEAQNSAGSDSYSAWSATDDVDYTGLAATYKMSNITFGVEMQKTEDKAETTALKAIEDETIVFVEYDLGGGAKVYAANRSSDSDYSATVSAQADQTAVGVSFAF